MTKYLNPIYLPWFIPAAGLLGIGLRVWLLADGFDKKGLLITGHPADALIWILTALVLALLVISCLPLVQASKYSFNYPASVTGAAGEALGAIGILAACIRTLSGTTDIVTAVCLVLGFLAVPALGYGAWCRLNGQQPPMYFHGTVCLFWMMRLVCQYRIWSPDPQLQDYGFQLLATVFLMLSSFHRAAFDADMGQRRLSAIFQLGAIYFCMISIPGCKDWLLYLCCGIWTALNLCSLLPMPNWHAQKEEQV